MNNPNLNLNLNFNLKTLPLRFIWLLLSHSESDSESDSECENFARRRERDWGCIAEYVDEIIDLLKAMGMSDEDCNVEEFISPLEEGQVNVIMMLHWFTNAKATLTFSLVFGRWKKC